MEKIDLEKIKVELVNFSGVKWWFVEEDIVDMKVIDDYVYYLLEIKVIIDVVC